MENRPREGNLALSEEQTQDVPDEDSVELSNTETLPEINSEQSTESEHEKNENIIVNDSVTASELISEPIVQKNKRMKKDNIASMIKSMILREKRATERLTERKQL